MAPQFVSSLSKTAETVPENYVYPPEWRADIDAPICHEIPVIDLSLATTSDLPDRAKLAEQLLKALEGGSGFQVINHEVSKKLMENAMEVHKEFFNLPIEDKEKSIKEWLNTGVTGLYSGSMDPAAKILLWVDTLVHYCYPLELSNIDSWPEKPATYREVISEYANETRKLSRKIFELIAEGLGLEKQYFDEIFTQNHNLRANYYPKSPDPSLTLGLPVHYDTDIITIMQQNAPGLQVLKDGKWMLVEPLPNAFFILPGMELQIVSNGRFKAVLHQVSTNAYTERFTINNFMSHYEPQAIIKPDKAFLNEENLSKKEDYYSYDKYWKIMKSKKSDGGARESLAELWKSTLDSFHL